MLKCCSEKVQSGSLWREAAAFLEAKEIFLLLAKAQQKPSKSPAKAQLNVLKQVNRLHIDLRQNPAKTNI